MFANSKLLLILLSVCCDVPQLLQFPQPAHQQCSTMPPLQHSPHLQTATMQQPMSQPQHQGYVQYTQPEVTVDGTNFYMYTAPAGVYHQPYVQPAAAGSTLPVAASEDQVAGAMTSSIVYYVPAHQGAFSNAPVGAGGTVPVWSTGGLPVTTAAAVSSSSPTMGVDGTEMMPATFGGVVMPSSSAVDMPSVAYGSQAIYLCQPTHGSQQQQQLYQVSQLQNQAPGLHSVDLALQHRNPLINSTNMEFVWHTEFDLRFKAFLNDYQHLWQLSPLDPQEDPRLVSTICGTKMAKDSAKVRFLCKKCGNAWTSMKGRVVFWIRLVRCHGSVGLPSPSLVTGSGSVQFKLFGQKCQKCNCDGYENALWYPEEVCKVIKNVFNRVGQFYYGFVTGVTDGSRRTGRPRTQHNSSHCQACAEGICNENREDDVSKSARSADLITEKLNGLALQPAAMSRKQQCLAQPFGIVVPTRTQHQHQHHQMQSLSPPH